MLVHDLGVDSNSVGGVGGGGISGGGGGGGRNLEERDGVGSGWC